MKNQLKLFLILSFVVNDLQLKAYGQSGYDYDRQNVYVNKTDESIKAKVISIQDKKIIADKDKTYFWYSNNQILETRGGYDGRLLDGKYSSFFLSNNLKENGEFRKGLKHGEWKSWFENGKLKEITKWNKGFREGYHEEYNEKGERILVCSYKNDKLNGKEIRYESGKIVSIKYYKNGQEIMENPSKEKIPLKKDSSLDQRGKKNKEDSIPRKINPVTKPSEKAKNKEEC